ncbi:hypothetical protein KI387_000159, partial [Taxus chinensis]
VPPSTDNDDDARVDDGYMAWYSIELPRNLPSSIDADEEDIAIVLERLERACHPGADTPGCPRGDQSSDKGDGCPDTRERDTA